MAEPRWLNTEEQATWRAFIAATRLLFDQLDRELQRDAGLPHAYYVILAMLSEAPERTPDIEYVPTPQNVVDKMLEVAKIGKDDVWVKRPGTGIPARQLNDVIGKTAKRAIAKDALVRFEDLN